VIRSPALERRVTIVDGIERPYLRCGTTASAGIVMCLHGSRSTPARQALLSGMERLGSEGAIVVFPQGSFPAGRGFAWDHDRDLPYLAHVIAEVSAEVGAPRPAVCMSGMSGGARMACHYAAARAEEVTMVGAVAGLRAPVSEPPRPVPIVAFHGLADRINPYRGGGGVRWSESVPDAAQAWATANGLKGAPTVTQISPTLSKTSYGEGTPAEVTLWTFQGAGHTWPGHAGGLLLRLFLGRTSNELDATAEIWRLFAKTQRADAETTP
jgi:polyhydroxybutyrate depolymerase